MSKIIKPLYAIVLFLFCSVQVHGQSTTAAKGTVKRVTVHGKNLEKNLLGDAADRHVSVYLPPGYSKNPQKRYPVVYFLHGFTDDDAKWYGITKHWINLPAILDSVFANNASQEMIFVTPDAFTRYEGSWYSNSKATGNWEAFVASELVAYMDKNYRTLAKAQSRGLAGHSMGGYGAMRIGQKHPEIFANVYLLSPALLNPGFSSPPPPAFIKNLEAIKTVEEVQKSDFFTKALFSCSAAWSADAANPPLYVKLPYKNGRLQPDVKAAWEKNIPLAVLDKNIGRIKKLNALGFDAGLADSSIAEGIRVLDKRLADYQVAHDFEIYEGDHINRIGDRISTKMLPFFSKHLAYTR